MVPLARREVDDGDRQRRRRATRAREVNGERDRRPPTRSRSSERGWCWATWRPGPAACPWSRWECLHVNRLIYTYLSITGLDQWFFIHVVRILASFCVSFLLLPGPNVTITQPSNSLLGGLAIRPGNFCPCWSSAKNIAFVVIGPVQALSPVTTILYLCFCQLEYKQKNSKINTQK